MRQINILYLLLLALLLSACQPQAAVVDSSSSTKSDEKPVAAPVENDDETDESIEVSKIESDQPVTDEEDAVQESEGPVVVSCTVENRRVLPTPDAADMVDIPAVTEGEWISGGQNALVTIVNYCDFQSTDCAEFEKVLEQLQEQYPEDVRIVFRHNPLPDHEMGLLAARAVEAAALQDEELFYQLKDFLFENQADWLNLTDEKFKTWLQQQSGVIGMDIMQFSNDLSSESVVAKIEDAQLSVSELDMEVAPIVVINGSIYRGPRDLVNLDSIIRLHRMEKNQFTTCPEIVINEQNEYQATIETTMGDILIELYPGEAPLAVNSFVYLAQKGWYDKEYFHNVVGGVAAQAGDPSGTGFGGPGFYTTAELEQDLAFDEPGVVAMYQVRPDQNGSQFFITFKSMAEMNAKYTIIGKVLEGMDVLEGLKPITPAQDGEIPQENIIFSVTIEEK